MPSLPVMRLRACLLLVALGVLGCGYPTYTYDDEAPDTAEPLPLDASSEVSGEVAPLGDGCIPNGCGGCGDGRRPGLRCEPCGQWACDGTDVKCVPSMPAVGTTCGLCATSSYACTATGTTACAMADDRLIYEDVGFTSKDTAYGKVTPIDVVLAAYPVTKKITYVDASVWLKRIPYVCEKVGALPHPDPACTNCKAGSGGFDCTVPTPVQGKVRVVLQSGTPETTLTELATATLDAASVAAVSGFVLFTFPTPIDPRTIGSMLSVEVRSDSTAHAFEVYGGGASAFPPAPASMSWWRKRTASAAGWVQEPASDLALVVRGKACAP